MPIHLGSITPGRYIAAKVANKCPQFKLSPQELDCLIQIYRLTKESKTLVAFLNIYQGPRESLFEILETRRLFLSKAAQGLITPAEFRALLPTDNHQAMWDHFHSQGWQIKFTRWQSPFTSAAIDRRNKRIRFRLSLYQVHPSLTFAHEVRHLQQYEAIDENRGKLFTYIKGLICQEERETANERARCSKIAGLGRSLSEKIFSHLEVSDHSIENLLYLITEREAWLEEIDLYEALVKKDPRQKVKTLEKLCRLSKEAAATVIINEHIAKIAELDLPYALIARMARKSLEELLMAAQKA